jgi:hypothetical protein
MRSLVPLVAPVFATSVAAAQPGMEEPIAPGPLPQTTLDTADQFVAGGAVAGIFDKAIVSAAMVEGGYRIADSPVWLHATMLGGIAGGTGIAENYHGSAVQYGGGVELHGCTRPGSFCVVLGLDLAYAHVQFMGVDDNFDKSWAMMIARVGPDYGFKHWRLRGSLDFGRTTERFDEWAIAGAVSYQW